MPRHRKAWLPNGTGVRYRDGRRIPGYYVYWQTWHAGRHSLHSRTFATLKQARAWMMDFNARLQLGLIDAVVPIPLSEATQQFAASRAALKPITLLHYLSALGMLHGLIGDLNVCDITGRHVDRFVAARLAVSAPTTVAKHIRSLRCFFRWCRHSERRYLSADPLSAAGSLPRGRRASSKPIVSEQDLERLLAALDTEDRKLAVQLALTTGLDYRVIVRLHTAQIDLDHHVIRIERPKTGKQLNLPIHPALRSGLAARLCKTAPYRPILAGLAREARDRDWWYLATAAVGLPTLRFRDLRAMAASRLQDLAGLSLTAVQALLGHSSPETTAYHYRMPSAETARALERLPLPGCPAAAGSTPPTRASGDHPA